MQRLSDFIAEHIGDDPARLALNRDKYPGMDVTTAVETLLSREKLRHKLPLWYAEPRLVLPSSLSAEQCSSSETAGYKAGLAARLCCEIPGMPVRIADLTGGLGADCAAFAAVAEEVLYNDMSSVLCDCVRFNFGILGIRNCRFSNIRTAPGAVGDIVGTFGPSLIYLDPARRSGSGGKLFLIEECSPDVSALKDELLEAAPFVMVKLSPMADISMVISRMGRCCREIHVTGTARECKELVVVLQRGYDGECRVKVGDFSFSLQEERTAVPVTATRLPEPGDLLFEPSKVMMKAGPFNLISSSASLEKMGRFTHIYIAREGNGQEIGFGPALLRKYEVVQCMELNGKNLKSVGKLYPRAEAVSYNVPLSSEELYRRVGCRSGEEHRIFAMHHDASSSNVLVVARKTTDPHSAAEV